MNAVELKNAAFLALSKVTGEAADRDAISDDSAFQLSGTVAGTINGFDFEIPLDCAMTVGKSSTRASSATPKLNEVVAAILSKLNAATREAVKRDILADFSNSGDVSATVEATAEAESFLCQLRRQVSQTVRGSVKLANIVEPALSFEQSALAAA